MQKRCWNSSCLRSSPALETGHFSKELRFLSVKKECRNWYVRTRGGGLLLLGLATSRLFQNKELGATGVHSFSLQVVSIPFSLPVEKTWGLQLQDLPLGSSFPFYMSGQLEIWLLYLHILTYVTSYTYAFLLFFLFSSPEAMVFKHFHLEFYTSPVSLLATLWCCRWFLEMRLAQAASHA